VLNHERRRAIPISINSLVAGGDVSRVAWLCAGILGATLLSAALKFALGYRLSVLGERIVLRIRPVLCRWEAGGAG
jgi:hypothetical protein